MVAYNSPTDRNVLAMDVEEEALDRAGLHKEVKGNHIVGGLTSVGGNGKILVAGNDAGQVRL